MKKSLYLIVLIISCFSCTNESKNNTVILKGTYANYEQDTLYMKNITSENMIYKEEVHNIALNKDTNFYYKFELEKPAYFQIGRTFLFLSPGDSLVATLDGETRRTATYSGTGSEANNYLTQVTYPKAGSYWPLQEEVSKIKDYKEAPEVFKNLTDKKITALEQLKNVSEEFKRLEKARIKFDYVNSLLKIQYLFYAQAREGLIERKDIKSLVEEAKDYYIPFVDDYLKDIDDTSYLQLEVFQTLLYEIRKEEFKAKHNLAEFGPEFQEYILTGNLINGFKNEGYTSTFIKKLNTELKNIKNPDYKAAILEEQKQYESISAGQPATDLTFTKLDGSTVKLSDFKGKVIVIDLWATWCGPCMRLKPSFEALEKKYESNDQIEFISLSLDTEKKWLNYFESHEPKGNQFHIFRNELANYKVSGIPRFFVIDKDFNIVDVFAPAPLNGELENLIKKHI
ncbi:TlpA family protein disulfide reductase [Gaetbulibacter saemankumensis]|uniref:TlpA family protein disulfide reductase n=1 Tax=Gaetbulibacter saemankumensis TaxID=311208 RepID=UPI000484A287|nr:TlpA disulfide reductase family protein [Gaetbulibacter saemankumensis]